jgi:transcriptional regulator with XRE-family HTH domain
MPKQNLRSDAAPAAVVDTVTRLGANIAAARVRRRWSQESLARKAGITRPTMSRVEAGELGTGIGAYVSALWAMGLHHDLADVADLFHDSEGRTLEAARMPKHAHAPSRLIDDAF